MRKVYVKEEVRIGCHLCEVYCQLQHAQSKDIIKAIAGTHTFPTSLGIPSEPILKEH